jgi:hypothetical protein
VTEVGRNRSKDVLPVVLDEARELLQVGAALVEARHGVRQVGRALALQRLSQSHGNRALRGWRIGVQLESPLTSMTVRAFATPASTNTQLPIRLPASLP